MRGEGEKKILNHEGHENQERHERKEVKRDNLHSDS